MAIQVFQFSVTIPAGTLQAAPQVTAMQMPAREVNRLEFRVPPGPRGEVGFRVGAAGTQLFPFTPGTWVVADDEPIGWDLEDQHDSGSWEFTAYNTGNYPHTIAVRFLVGLVGKAPSAGLQPIPASSLGPDAGAVGTPPSTELPPSVPTPVPPPVPTPVLLPPPPLPPPVPIPVPPPPPPPPPIPPPPILTPPPPIGGPPPAAPVLNFWSESMGRLLTYPDQSAGPRFDELLVLPNGNVGWYGWRGGAGQWESYNGGATNLGGQVAEVSGAFVLVGGKVTLYVIGTTAAGVRFLKIMDPQTSAVLQDWTQQPGPQSMERPLSQRAAAP